MKEINAAIRKRVIKKRVVHFKNSRTKKTICGHNYEIPGRTYSNITCEADNVTCKACKNAMKKCRWLKEIVDNKNKSI